MRITTTNAQEELVVIDLTGRRLRRDLLVYGSHENAKPYLQDYEKPSNEDLGNAKARSYFLCEILRDPSHPFDVGILRDYFEQLHAIVGGKRWVVLVPDRWPPERQEEILRATPFSRRDVMLLWRSVAAVLGAREQLRQTDENWDVEIFDLQQNGRLDFSRLTLLERGEDGFRIPQRKSYQRNLRRTQGGWRYATEQLRFPSKEFTEEERFLYGRHNGEPSGWTGFRYILEREYPRKSGENCPVIFLGRPDEEQRNWLSAWARTQFCVFEGAESLVECGARFFDEKCRKGEIPYYDELEALSLIIQTQDERIVPKELVKGNEKFPGGKCTDVITNDDVNVRRGEKEILFLLCMGEATPNAQLRELETTLPSIPEQNERLHIEAVMTPGQGMANVTVTAPFLKHPVELDFLAMKETERTIASIEKEMERTFPPDCPDVISDGDLWWEVSSEVEDYMHGKVEPDGSWFAKAENIYGGLNALPHGASPLEILRRKNVFGSDKKRRFPCSPDEFPFTTLFAKLADDYVWDFGERREAIIRLVAWTYQGDNPLFFEMKNDALRKIRVFSRGGSQSGPRPQTYTLCANLCSTPEDWKICLSSILNRLENDVLHASEFLRLLYNLLQFHPTLILDTGWHENDRCWDVMKFLPICYERHKDSSQHIGYVLKSMLYLLRCRRFDGKRFLMKTRDAEHYQIIADCLSHRVHPAKEELRELVLKYLDGKGTIEGLPTD
jgi:hypothetical protein